MKIRMAKRPGFTLIEILCVMALLAVLGLVLALILKETLEVERLQSQGFEQMLQTNLVADQFRTDVAQAELALPDWEQYRADVHTLILALKNGKHVVYRWQEGKLQRRAFNAKEEVERVLPLDGSRVQVEFVRGDANSRLLRLRLQTMRKGVPLPGQTLEIAAALGGDWR